VSIDVFCLVADINALIVGEATAGRSISQYVPEVVRRLGEIFYAESSVIALNPDLQADHTYWHHHNWQATAHTAGLTDWLCCPAVRQHVLQAPLFQVVRLDVTIGDAGIQLAESWALATHSILLVNMGMAGTWNGTLGCLFPTSRSWGLAELQSLERGLALVAQALAIAIGYSHNIRQTKLLQNQLHQGIERQVLLDRLMAAIRGSLELTEILHMATEGIAELLAGDRSMVLLLNYTDPLLKQRHAAPLSSQLTAIRPPSATAQDISHQVFPPIPPRDLPEQRKPAIRVALGAQWQRTLQSPVAPTSTRATHTSFFLSECALCQQAFADPHGVLAMTNAKTAFAADPLTAPHALFEIDLLPAVLLAPIEYRGTVLGFLVVQRQILQCWQPDDRKLIEQVSSQISTAIIQLQTLRQVRALVEERTSQLCRSLEVQAKLYEITRRQVTELQALNQFKSEFLGTVNHELRTPLTSMCLAIRMLRQPDLAEHRRDHYLNILEECCNHEIELINDLLMLQELELKQFVSQPEWVDFSELVTEIATGFREKWRDSKVDLVVDVPSRLYLQSNRDNLHRILVELLTNARKHASAHTQVVVRAELEGDPQQAYLSLTLCSRGLGISAEELENIFEPFQTRTYGVDRVLHGTGLGLALVQGLVHHMQGTIRVTSQPIVPTTLGAPTPIEADTQLHINCFTIRIPQYPHLE
jgi:signal transduction histidine kinase